MEHIGKAFRTVDVVKEVLLLERAGLIKTKGYRGKRLELTVAGLRQAES